MPVAFYFKLNKVDLSAKSVNKFKEKEPMDPWFSANHSKTKMGSEFSSWDLPHSDIQGREGRFDPTSVHDPSTGLGRFEARVRQNRKNRKKLEQEEREFIERANKKILESFQDSNKPLARTMKYKNFKIKLQTAINSVTSNPGEVKYEVSPPGYHNMVKVTLPNLKVHNTPGRGLSDYGQKMQIGLYMAGIKDFSLHEITDLKAQSQNNFSSKLNNSQSLFSSPSFIKPSYVTLEVDNSEIVLSTVTHDIYKNKVSEEDLTAINDSRCDSFDGLMNMLREHKSLYVKGQFGQAYYDGEPKPSRNKIGSRAVQYWSGKQRKETPSSTSATVVLICANKNTKNGRPMIYYLAREGKPVMTMMSYERFKLALENGTKSIFQKGAPELGSEKSAGPEKRGFVFN